MPTWPGMKRLLGHMPLGVGASAILTGEIEPAAVLWRTIEVSQRQLRLRQRWYNQVAGLQQGDWVAEAMARTAEE